jgi:hypothetical protein
MKSIHESFKEKGKLNANIFVKFRTLEKEKIFSLITKALKLCIKPTMIIDCDGKNCSEIDVLVEKLNQSEINERIVLVAN